MSKISITLDTQSQELIVKVDGEVVDNVKSASIYCYEDYATDEDRVGINISQCIEGEKGDLHKYIMLSAKDKSDIVKSVEAGTPLQNQIGSFLKAR